MTQEGRNNLLLPLNSDRGWDEDLKKEVEGLISKLTPKQVIRELRKLIEDQSSSKKSIGRPKSYKTAWIKLENNLIGLEEFKTLVHQQLVDGEITNHTYYRAIRKAKKFIAHKKVMDIAPKTYEEAWAAVWAGLIKWSKFETILKQLLKDQKITRTKYEDGLNKAMRYKELTSMNGDK